MTEPRRLLDEASGIEREILESAMHDDPSPRRRHRVAAAVVAGSAASLSTGSAVAAGGKVAATWATWKVVVGIAAITAAVSVSVARRQPVVAVHAQPSASMVVVAPPPVVPSASVVLPPSTPAIAPSVSVAKPRVVPSVVEEPEVEAGPPLAHETALLDQARAAIGAGDGAKALAALDRYRIECKAGVLALEAEVLRIEAVATTGDRARASSLARAFLAAHPGTAYETRIHKHVVDPIQ